MPRGVVTLVFDDGYQNVYDHILPLLARYGVRAVFAIPVKTEQIAHSEGVPVAPLAAWRGACARGDHELAAHGVTHRAFTTLDDPTLRAELELCREVTGATTVVYPGGAHDDRVMAEAKPLFGAGRTVRRGLETLPPADPLQLHSHVATRRNFRVWLWNLRALWAWIANRWLIETYHAMSLSSEEHPDQHTVPLEAFERHLRFVRKLPVRLATIRETM